LTLAYGDGLTSRKTLAMKDTQTQVRLNGCSAVLADPSGLDYYVTNYSNNAWSQLLAQGNALKDPVLLTSLQLEAKLLVNNGLADPSRVTSIGSLSPAATPLARQLLMTAPTTQSQRPTIRYQGKFKAKPQAQQGQ
jgi:aminopeptidase N